MGKNSKKEILIFLIAISILTMLLSTGLSNMSFKKGMPFPVIDHGKGIVSIPDDNINSAVSISNLGKIILIIITTVVILTI